MESVAVRVDARPHGRASTYKSGCRCAECRADHTAYMLAYHHRRKAIDPAYCAGRRRIAREYSQRMRKDKAKWGKALGQARALRLARRERLAQIKLARGCTDCGYRASSVALDFDHVSGSKFHIVSKLVTWSWPKVLSEIEKGEVVCANCHRVRTAARLTRKAV